MTKFVLVLYMCSQLSGQCPSYHYPGLSFDTHTACVEYGYRAAHSTFKNLDSLEEFDQDYIENNRIAVRFRCEAVQTKKEVIPPPKPKIAT